MLNKKILLRVCVLCLACAFGRSAQAAKWLIVTGMDSGRFLWAVVPIADSSDNPNELEANVSIDFLLDNLSKNLGLPILAGNSVSFGSQPKIQTIPASLLKSSHTVDLLHYLQKSSVGADGGTGFELQIKCPAQAILSHEVDPFMVETSVTLSLNLHSKDGFIRMLRLANVIGGNVTKVRIRAFDEKSVKAPELMAENASSVDLINFWKANILEPLGIECNSILYDDTLACLVIDVKKIQYGDLENVSRMYWNGEILLK